MGHCIHKSWPKTSFIAILKYKEIDKAILHCKWAMGIIKIPGKEYLWLSKITLFCLSFDTLPKWVKYKTIISYQDIGFTQYLKNRQLD